MLHDPKNYVHSFLDNDIKDVVHHLHLHDFEHLRERWFDHNPLSIYDLWLRSARRDTTNTKILVLLENMDNGSAVR